MKTIKISEIPVIPERLGERFEPCFEDTDMTEEELLYVSGLIKYYEP